MENLGYLLAAFAIVWAVMFGYVFMLSRRQGQLRREIELLKKQRSGEPREGKPE